MSSSTPSKTDTTANPTSTSDSSSSSTAVAKKLPELLPLEEDDEFEEFSATDWADTETYGAKLSAEKKGKKDGIDSLWEDNWDDDDVEDDFSVQLRAELAKQDKMQS